MGEGTHIGQITLVLRGRHQVKSAQVRQEFVDLAGDMRWIDYVAPVVSERQEAPRRVEY
jgi:hypothetical protein